MVQKHPKWSEIVQHDPKWFNIVQILQTGPNWSEVVQTSKKIDLNSLHGPMFASIPINLSLTALN